MRRLDTYTDGRRFAVDALRKLEEAGTEKCRADVPRPYKVQADALILALLEVKERGTTEAACGFAQILTDLAGTRAPELAEFYAQMDRAGKIRPYRLKRAVNRGYRLGVLALRREAEGGSTSN